MLTETAIRKAKAPAKPTKLSDERGLYLLCTPNGGKWWRFKYRHNGKEKLLSLGTYPEVSLAKAREDREQARRELAVGGASGKEAAGYACDRQQLRKDRPRMA